MANLQINSFPAVAGWLCAFTRLLAWGRAPAGDRATVALAGQQESGVADDSGAWRVVLGDLAAGRESRTLTLRDTDGAALALAMAQIRGLRGEPPPTPGLRREGSRGDEKANS